jgi:hypothetical protein
VNDDLLREALHHGVEASVDGGARIAADAPERILAVLADAGYEVVRVDDNSDTKGGY